jgi:opacity protein-like surface antigen
VCAQEIYYNSGINNTKYLFNGTDGLPLQLRSKMGRLHEIGYRHQFDDKRFQYGIGLAINNFDAWAGDAGNNYEWETSFLGINNQLEYALSDSSTIGRLAVFVGLQLQIMHIINGQQYINGALFDLTKEDEFTGLWVQPGLLVTCNYSVNDILQLSLGYNYSMGFNFFNLTDEKLRLSNHQIRFGLNFIIK